jgi:polyphosphate kinase
MGATNKARQSAVDETAEGSGDKLKTKDYERALARLHVELVRLQQWVVGKGLKICIVFEGRDGAGKGGATGRGRGRG